jgi:hypothetical protein
MTPKAASIFDPQIDPTERVYAPGSSLEVPGLEAILEYGDATKFDLKSGRIPNSLLINDQSQLDMVRITQLEGLHDDPETAESRQGNSDRHGERAGNMRYRGRTVGLTGRVQAGNIGAMRNLWRRLRGQFGVDERDLVIHHPFEVRAYTNEVLNPNLDVDAFGWEAVSTAGGTVTETGGITDGVGLVGEMFLTGATGAGLLRAMSGVDGSAPWSGEDVWITARLAPLTSLGSPVSSIAIGVAQAKRLASNYGETTFPTFATVATPATDSWNLLSARVPASAIDPDTEYVTTFAVVAFSAAGNHGMLINRVACVLLDPDDPTPSAYFGGELPGFSHKGIPGRSTSFGPTHSENLIFDPLFEFIKEDTSGGDIGIRFLYAWQGTATGTGATVNQAPVFSTRWRGDRVSRSLYFKATSGTSGSSDITVSPLTFPSFSNTADASSSHQAVANRRYRLSFKVNLISKPSNGNLVAEISWRNQAGAEISAATSTPLIVGENYASVEATAPAGTILAIAKLRQVTTTTGAALELFLSDPCWIDVTDWDPGDFSGGSGLIDFGGAAVDFGDSDGSEEVVRVRRIPRPFLIRRVRKTGDMKAPEQQSRSRAWRDFSMSLRASDPRIYCLDERSESIVLPTTAEIQHFSLGSNDFTTGVTPPPVPTNSTYEGHSLPASSEWSIDVNPYLGTLIPQHVNSGRGFKLWTTDNSYITRPASPVLARFYRNTYTYEKPRVILGCSPVGISDLSLPDRGAAEFPGWITGSTTNANLAAWNYVSIIKRINSTTWLELRWNSLPYYRALVSNPSVTNAPHAFELWCSHNTSGTLATTRLEYWDYLDEALAPPGNVPFDPTSTPTYLKFEMASPNFVSWGLYSSYPGSSTPVSGFIVGGFYELPSPVNTLVGPSVAGNVGAAMKVDNPTGDSSSIDSEWETRYAWERLAGNTPFIHHFEAVKSEWTGTGQILSVIGDADDTPPIFELTGMLVDPTIYFYYTGAAPSAPIFLKGTIAAGEKLTIDMTDGGSIKSSFGTNRYDMLQPGSDLPMLRTGERAFVSFVASDWDETLREHLKIRWRDALV